MCLWGGLYKRIRIDYSAIKIRAKINEIESRRTIEKKSMKQKIGSSKRLIS